jgi:hypothetical protein
MQMQELQIKKQEADIKAKKLVADSAAKADQLRIEEQRIASQERIAGMQIGARAENDKMQLATKTRMEGIKVYADMSKNREQGKPQKDKK